MAAPRRDASAADHSAAADPAAVLRGPARTDDVPLELRPTAFDHPDAVALIAEVQAYYAQVYGGEDSTPVSAAEFAPPRGHFLIGYRDGQPVACGGWRLHPHAELGLRAGDAELKRLYVRPAHRGHGYARMILAALEASAAAAGGHRTVLETGTRQPEAIALYRRCGYTRIDGFGHYRDSPDSRCFAKALPAPATR